MTCPFLRPMTGGRGLGRCRQHMGNIRHTGNPDPGRPRITVGRDLHVIGFVLPAPPLLLNWFSLPQAKS
ncbi:hypothetical protein VTJ49DRAFT_1050 [Mycothermus thermophilus]|uniref:Uncharacterized protein n=1 Tax=Humicola insolens TaxID=85995 RepID=A0ABR3VDD7_HUMIN